MRYMERYPAAQAELRAALKAAFPDNEPSLEDILRVDITYLDAALNEGLRLAGTSKGNAREACVDTEILGCKIPKGAQIFLNYHIDRAPVAVDESLRTAGYKAVMSKLGDGFQQVVTSVHSSPSDGW